MAREVEVVLPELHTGQLRRRERIRERKARFVVTMCGRRWGKTVDGGDWIVDGALDGEPCGWFAPTYKYLIEVWDDMAARLRPVARNINKTEKRIELHGGGLIEFWTLDDPDAGRSRKYKRIVVDEAGLVRNLKQAWQTALRPTLVDYRGAAWFYGTPKGRSHDFSTLYAYAETDTDGEWLAHRAPTRENPHIPADEIEAAKRELPEGAFLQEFEGVPADDGGNPFGLTAIAACLGPLSDNPPVVWGWDFARAQDWTVGIALDAYGKVCKVERWQGRPWGDTIRDVVRITGKCQAVGDSTGVGDSVVEAIQTRGCPMEGYPFTPKSKQALMQRLASAIQNKQVTIPEGEGLGFLRSELETFTYEYTAHGVRYTAPDGLHDDAVMALALAVYGYDRTMPMVEAMQIPIDRERDMTDWRELVGVDPVSGEAAFAGQFPEGF